MFYMYFDYIKSMGTIFLDYVVISVPVVRDLQKIAQINSLTFPERHEKLVSGKKNRRLADSGDFSLKMLNRDVQSLSE